MDNEQKQLPTEDEINLFDLWETLMNGKKTVILSVVISMSIALAYALTSPVVYKASSKLLPPSASDVQGLSIVNLQSSSASNVINSVQVTQGIQGLNVVRVVDEVYDLFKLNLSSKNIQRQFFIDNNLAAEFSNKEKQPSIERMVENFSGIIGITKFQDKKNKNNASLSIEWRNPVQAADWVNKYVQLVNDITVKSLVDSQIEIVRNKINNVKYKIESKRKLAHQRIEDRIAALEEADLISKQNITKKIAGLRSQAKVKRKNRLTMLAEQLKIAQKLDIHERSLLTKKTKNNQIEINISSTPLYMYGTKALQSEIDVLQARTNHDPFIPELHELQQQLYDIEVNSEVAVLKNRKDNDSFITGLRDLQEDLARLESFEINDSAIQSVSIDKYAYPPEQRIKPNRRLIVISGLVSGLIFGIFVVFFINFLRKQLAEKEKIDQGVFNEKHI